MERLGTEIDCIVSDARKAFETYQAIFDVNCVEKTDLPLGQNEVVFTLYGTRFHLLDENLDLQMVAPDGGMSVWFNIAVPNIEETFQKALAAGCTAIQPVVELEGMGAKTAMVSDPFGYLWQLHQILCEVSLEERLNRMQQKS